MRREIPWNWFRPGPERDAARARQRKRLVAATDRALSRARAERRALTAEDRDGDIRHLWSEGWTGRALARRFGLANSTVSGIVAGMPPRRRYGDPEDVTWPHPRRRCRVAPAPGDDRPPPPGPSRPSDPSDRLGARETVRGSAHGRAKLDEPRVARMKRLRLEGWTTGMLAREFGVGRNTVCYILTGKTWRHVEAAPPAIGGNP